MKEKQYNKLNNIKAVIFDLDGTLLYTLQDIGDALNETLKLYHYPPYTLDEIRYLVGHGARWLLEKALEPFGTNVILFDEIFAVYKRIYTEHLKKTTQPYSGMIETLCLLKCNDIKVFCNTNKPHNDAVECLNYYFGRDTFDKIIGQKDNCPVKPAPDGVNIILKEYQLEPSQVIYIGDSHVDIATAINSHCVPVGALWGYRTREELAQAGAVILLDKPLDLLELIASEADYV